MKLIIVQKNGSVSVLDDVLDYNCWTKEDILRNTNICSLETLTEEQLEKVADSLSCKLQNLEEFANNEEFISLLNETISEVKGE